MYRNLIKSSFSPLFLFKFSSTSGCSLVLHFQDAFLHCQGKHIFVSMFAPVLLQTFACVKFSPDQKCPPVFLSFPFSFFVSCLSYCFSLFFSVSDCLSVSLMWPCILLFVTLCLSVILSKHVS